MSFFSRGRKSDNASKKAQQDSKKKQEDSAKQNAILSLQRTFGNKAVMQMLMQQKNDTQGVKPDAMGLRMVEDFPAPKHPLMLNGWSVVYKQVYAYSRIISGYKNYVDKMLAGNALMLFHQYKNGFTKGIQGLLKNVMIPNVDSLIMILRTVASGKPEEGEKDPEGVQNDKDDGNNEKDENAQRLKILQDLKRELERRMNGADLDEINKRIPGVDPASLKSPAMLSFQKDIMSGAVFTKGQDDYFLAFLKKNDIDIEIFKQVVQTEDEKNRNESETAAAVEDRLKKWQEEQQRIKNVS